MGMRQSKEARNSLGKGGEGMQNSSQSEDSQP